MRISISLLFAAIISFALLVVMTRLVQSPTILPQPPISVLPDIPLEPPEPEPNKPVRTLPKQDKTATPPQQTAIDIVPLPNEPVDRALPPFYPQTKPGTEFAKWPGVDGPGFPGDTSRGDDGAPVAGLRPISQIAPLFPREQAAKGVQGSVTLRFEVRQDGSVGNVQVLNATPRGAFEAAAIRAVQRWRYRPTEQAPVVQTITLDFNLEQ